MRVEATSPLIDQPFGDCSPGAWVAEMAYRKEHLLPFVLSKGRKTLNFLFYRKVNPLLLFRCESSKLGDLLDDAVPPAGDARLGSPAAVGLPVADHTAVLAPDAADAVRSHDFHARLGRGVCADLDAFVVVGVAVGRAAGLGGELEPPARVGGGGAVGGDVGGSGVGRRVRAGAVASVCGTRVGGAGGVRAGVARAGVGGARHGVVHGAEWADDAHLATVGREADRAGLAVLAVATGLAVGSGAHARVGAVRAVDDGTAAGRIVGRGATDTILAVRTVGARLAVLAVGTVGAGLSLRTVLAILAVGAIRTRLAVLATADRRRLGRSAHDDGAVVAVHLHRAVRSVLAVLAVASVDASRAVLAVLGRDQARAEHGPTRLGSLPVLADEVAIARDEGAVLRLLQHDAREDRVAAGAGVGVVAGVGDHHGAVVHFSATRDQQGGRSHRDEAREQLGLVSHLCLLPTFKGLLLHRKVTLDPDSVAFVPP